MTVTTIVCAPDSFKESMTALEAAEAMATGIRRAAPDVRCVTVPMADGGEGTARSVTDALGGRMVELAAHDALGRPRTVSYGFVDRSGLAIIESAEAIGLAQLAPAERDPLVASSFGAGEMLRHSLDLGARKVVLGLGGSATNDGGAGLLTALGARFLDSSGELLPPGGGGLARLFRIDLTGLDPRLADLDIELACDVDNPLLGPSGASAVFGPQKGATPDQVAFLDEALRRWADLMEEATGVTFRDRPGAGAAGGLGTGLMAVAHPLIRPGVDIVIDAVGLPGLVAGADYVFTGEGSIDAQTLRGKTLMGVRRVAADAGVPVVMFGGRVSDQARPLLDLGVRALVPIVQGVSTLEDALAEGAVNLAAAAETATRLLVGSGD